MTLLHCKYVGAIPRAEQYVALAREKHGEGHREFATAIAWLAGLYQAEGRYDDAEPLYKRSLTKREKALGPDHPDVGQSLNNLAELYGARSDTESVARWPARLRRAYAGRGKILIR